MQTNGFYPMGAQMRQDQLLRLSEYNYLLIYGFVKDKEIDAEDAYCNWRKNYDHKPSVEELKADIHSLINKATDEAILNGFSWNGKPVYLSIENQMNFKAAYDLAYQQGGATLPLKVKLGEDADGNPVYHTFQKLESFTDFYTKSVAHINACRTAGWAEKDSIDWNIFTTEE